MPFALAKFYGFGDFTCTSIQITNQYQNVFAPWQQKHWAAHNLGLHPHQEGKLFMDYGPKRTVQTLQWTWSPLLQALHVEGVVIIYWLDMNARDRFHANSKYVHIIILIQGSTKPFQSPRISAIAALNIVPSTNWTPWYSVWKLSTISAVERSPTPHQEKGVKTKDHTLFIFWVAHGSWLPISIRDMN